MCSVVVVSLVVCPFLVSTVVCIECTQPLLVCPLHVVVYILPPCLTCMLFLVPCWECVQLFPVWASWPSLVAYYVVHQYIHTLCFPPYTGPRF